MPESDPDSAIDIHVHLALEGYEYALFDIPEDPEAAASRMIGALPTGEPSVRPVLLPPIFYTMPAGAADVSRLNRLMVAVKRQGGTALAAAFGVAEPKHGTAAEDELDHMAEAGLSGVVWSPRAQGLFANDELLAGLVRCAAEKGLLSMIHATPLSLNEGLGRIWHLTEQCPGVPIVILGALASWEYVGAILADRHERPNVHYDTSGIADARHLEALAAQLGSDKLVFGSGAHQSGAQAMLCGARAGIRDSAMPGELKRAILHGNAARLLGTGQ